MVTVDQLSGRLKEYIMNQVNVMSKTDPMISLIKPLITRAVDKNVSKASGMFSMIADENGNIDIEAILSEMAESIITTEPFTLHAPYVGDIEIGGGSIKLNLPLTNKKLMFNQADLHGLKEALSR